MIYYYYQLNPYYVFPSNAIFILTTYAGNFFSPFPLINAVNTSYPVYSNNVLYTFSKGFPSSNKLAINIFESTAVQLPKIVVICGNLFSIGTT